MQVLTLYSIDVWDGGDKNNHKFYMETEEAAKDYLKGNSLDTYHKVDLVIYKDKQDTIDNSEEAIKARALLKLTEEERYVLGIK